MARPRDALLRLRQERDDGSLDRFCRREGIDLLVAFGSAVDPDRPTDPNDLDLAVLLAPGRSLLVIVESLITHLDTERIDVMDLARADSLARTQALAPGDLLHEREPGVFAEAQIQAVMQHADTAWMREVQLEVLAR